MEVCVRLFRHLWISEAHNSQLQKGTLTVHRQQLFQCNRGFNLTVFHVEVKLNFALFCKEDSVGSAALGVSESLLSLRSIKLKLFKFWGDFFFFFLSTKRSLSRLDSLHLTAFVNPFISKVLSWKLVKLDPSIFFPFQLLIGMIVPLMVQLIGGFHFVS